MPEQGERSNNIFCSSIWGWVCLQFTSLNTKVLHKDLQKTAAQPSQMITMIEVLNISQNKAHETFSWIRTWENSVNRLPPQVGVPWNRLLINQWPTGKPDTSTCVSTSLFAHEAGPLVVFLRQLLACYTIATKLVLPFDMVTYDKHIRWFQASENGFGYLPQNAFMRLWRKLQNNMSIWVLSPTRHSPSVRPSTSSWIAQLAAITTHTLHQLITGGGSR